MNPKFSVLIIEDETHILNFMRKILTSHDYKVLSANTGKAGLEIIPFPGRLPHGESMSGYHPFRSGTS